MPRFLVLALLVQPESDELQAVTYDFDNAAVDRRSGAGMVEDGGYEAPDLLESVLKRQLELHEVLKYIRKASKHCVLTQVESGEDCQLTEDFQLQLNGEPLGQLMNAKQRQFFIDNIAAGLSMSESLRRFAEGGLAVLHDRRGCIYRLFGGKAVREAEKAEKAGEARVEAVKVPPGQNSQVGKPKSPPNRAPSLGGPAAAVSQTPSTVQPPAPETARPAAGLEDLLVALLQRAVSPLQQEVQSLAQQQARMAEKLADLSEAKQGAAQVANENAALKAELESLHLRLRQLETEKQAALTRAKYTLRDQLREGALQLRGYDEEPGAIRAGTRLLEAVRAAQAEQREDWADQVRDQVAAVDAMHEDILLVRRLLIEAELMNPRQGGVSGE